jgi:hypothetical protein
VNYELLRRTIINYLAYFYHSFGQVPEVNSHVLEAILAKSFKDSGLGVVWNQGEHKPWDLLVEGKRIQIKGTLLKNKKIHISSFRLGLATDSFLYTSESEEEELREQVFKYLDQIDGWLVLVREVKPTKVCFSLWFLSKDSNCFIYNPDYYQFARVIKTKKNKVGNNKKYHYQCIKNEIKTYVEPSTSHQLWYVLSVETLEQQGGKLLDKFEVVLEDLPRMIELKEQGITNHDDNTRQG